MHGAPVFMGAQARFVERELEIRKQAPDLGLGVLDERFVGYAMNRSRQFPVAELQVP